MHVPGIPPQFLTMVRLTKNIFFNNALGPPETKKGSTAVDFEPWLQIPLSKVWSSAWDAFRPTQKGYIGFNHGFANKNRDSNNNHGGCYGIENKIFVLNWKSPETQQQSFDTNGECDIPKRGNFYGTICLQHVDQIPKMEGIKLLKVNVVAPCEVQTSPPTFTNPSGFVTCTSHLVFGTFTPRNSNGWPWGLRFVDIPFEIMYHKKSIHPVCIFQTLNPS